MSCGAGFANRLLQKVELELLAAKKRRLENEAKCWRLAKKCLEAIKRVDEKFEPFRTCLDCKLREECQIWRNLRMEGVFEYEEMPIKCPYKSPETALEAKLNRQAGLDAESPTGFRGCGKRSE